jgi:hypothetical protein
LDRGPADGATDRIAAADDKTVRLVVERLDRSKKIVSVALSPERL